MQQTMSRVLQFFIHYKDFMRATHVHRVLRLYFVALIRNLTNSNLRGPVPTAIGSLTSLQYLDISNIMYSSTNLNNVTGDMAALAPLLNLQLV